MTFSYIIRRYGYFLLGHFVAGHIMYKTPVKITKEDKMYFMAQGGQNANLVKTLYILY